MIREEKVAESTGLRVKDPLAVLETIVTVVERFGPTAWVWLQGLAEAVGAPGEELRERLDAAMEEMRRSRVDVREELDKQLVAAREQLSDG